jgi:hypothetical protein
MTPKAPQVPSPGTLRPKGPERSTTGARPAHPGTKTPDDGSEEVAQAAA